MTKGMVIQLEGLDGSGKQTQTALLLEALRTQYPDRKIVPMTFPNYGNPSAAPIENYLSGSLKESEQYAYQNGMADQWIWGLSLSYAIDRFFTFATIPEGETKSYIQLHHEGAIIVSDRYTSSNIVFQAYKHSDPAKYIRLVEKQEHEKLGTPRPDLTLYLDIDPRVSMQYVAERETQDIYETEEHQLAVFDAFNEHIRPNVSWTFINCTEDGQYRTREAIHADILNHTMQLLKGEKPS